MALDPDGVIRPTSQGDKAEMLDTKGLAGRVAAYVKPDPVMGGRKFFDAQSMASDFVVMLKLTSGGHATKEDILQKMGALWDNLDVKQQRVILQ